MYSQSYGPKFPNGPYEFLSIAEQSMGGGYYADKNPILNWNGHFFCIYQDYCSKDFSEQKVNFFRLLI